MVRSALLTSCRTLSGMRSIVGLAASLSAAFAVLAVAAPAVAAPAYPQAEGRCVDQTETLGQALCAKVTAILLRDEKSAAAEIAVAVVPTTGESSIEAWSTGLFNTWGVGKSWKNDGVLLVVALDDHKVRLETGRGVRQRLSDAEAATIVDGVTSHFTAAEYALGILTGLDDVRRQLGPAPPADALLAPLAPAAPAPTPDLAGDDGSTGWSDDSEVWSDGSEFASPEDFGSADGDGAGPVLAIAIGGFAVVALVGFAVSRGSSRPTGDGSTHLAAWQAGSAHSPTTSSSSGSDSAGSSGSGFGGGSSDGGGATGSW